MATPTRRSGREQKANPKYLDTGWDKTTLRLLRESSESSGSSPSDESAIEAVSSDEEFEIQAVEHAEELSSSEDEGLSDASTGLAIRTPTESDEDIIGVTSVEPGGPRRKQSHLPAAVGGLPKDTGSGRSRGIAAIHRKSSKHVVYPQIFGPDIIDLKPTLHARDTWLRARDITLPSLRTLAESGSSLIIPGDLSVDLAIDNDVVDIAKYQECETREPEFTAAAKYLIFETLEHPIALGPVGKQYLSKLAYLHTLDVSRAWSQAAAASSPDESQSYPVPLQAAVTTDHRGWIINVGEKIQSLAWLPGNNHSSQYLAIVCRNTSKQRSAGAPTSTTRSPAFYPSLNHPSSIQLWEFDTAKSVRENAPSPSTHAIASPRLRTIYSIESGDVRHLLWQPPISSHASNLMAVLSTDGSVRLLALDVRASDSQRPTYIQIKTPATQFPPPSNAVFTTMCWASTTDLILGASNGTIHAYNILDYPNPKPYLTHQIHSTYIMNIASTYPSQTPTLIASTSASGDLLLTDLRAPDQDRVHVQKARLPTKPLIYSPLTRSFITVTDTSGTTDPRGTSSTLVQCHHLRHFYGSLHICRLPEMSGPATALAGSTHHPCILIGNAKGSVFATNYVRRTLPGKAKNKQMGGFLQKIFDYDWRPLDPSAEDSNDNNNGRDKRTGKGSNNEDIDLFHGHDVRPGISRFTEGFKPEHIDLTSGGPKHKTKIRKHTAASGDAAKPSTSKEKGSIKHRKQKMQDAVDSAADVVFEEEQAVTALEWNPNRKHAGWAAMGWGSGIVRVMDLSHDAK